MKTLTIAVALGAILIQGAPVAQAQECEQRVIELERRVSELEAQIAGLTLGSGNVETRRTTTGAVFTRVERKGFGESWRDPSGMIWGNIAKNADGSIRHMSQYQAFDYCLSMNPDSSERDRIRAALKAGRDPGRGVYLPRREDFVRLREYMGARSGTYEGYTPQVLPNLTRNEDDRTYSNYFWSSSVHPDDSNYAYDFTLRYGDIYNDNRDDDDGTVRCVARR